MEALMKSVAEELVEKVQLETRAENILKILAARGLRVSSRARQRILSCQDPDTLDRWFTRAVHATKTAEVFSKLPLSYDQGKGKRPAHHRASIQPNRNEGFPPIKLPSGAVVQLRRCSDEFFGKAAALIMPIRIDFLLLMDLCGYMNHKLGLPQMYAVLTTLTGPSGKFYDKWKGAFNFSFKLTVRRGAREFRYLLCLMNYRSQVEPNLFRVQKPGESYSRHTYHAPFDDEFSEDDITRTLNNIYTYLAIYLKIMPKWTTPFVKGVESEHILFGYDPRVGDFFEESYPGWEDYQAALERWRTVIPPEVPTLEDW
jgi:hypothetical protein